MKTAKPLPTWDTPPKTVDVLKKRVVAILEKGWCIDFLALDGSGWGVSVESPDARKCCLLGAMLRADGQRGSSVYLELVGRLDAACGKHFAVFNNAQTSAKPVIELVKRA